MSQRTYIITPGHPWSPLVNIFLSSLGSTQPMCATSWDATRLIKHNNHLNPHRFPFLVLAWEKQLWISVLLQDTGTMVVVRIRTHILTTHPWGHESDALNHSVMAPLNDNGKYVPLANDLKIKLLKMNHEINKNDVFTMNMSQINL